jgi:lipopolysaccharide transport system ATP-binding protein
MNSSIIVDRIGKAYRVGNSRKERFKEWFLPFYKPKTQPHWVLSDISFTIQQGEAVGIIGMNGAGKSTLLKIITGTTAPSTGSVSFHGRAAALLELGMGFHPDFTGRQNIALAGQLIGLSSEEIQLKTPAIETFAEIGEAIDEPVRTYSSGMQMRLAFALATAVRPDILIVDEALSVGDTYFQQKSFNKIREFREQGTTLLFVSHDKSAVLQLCDRAILLNHGVSRWTARPMMSWMSTTLLLRNVQTPARPSDRNNRNTVSKSFREIAEFPLPMSFSRMNKGLPSNAFRPINTFV